MPLCGGVQPGPSGPVVAFYSVCCITLSRGEKMVSIIAGLWVFNLSRVPDFTVGILSHFQAKCFSCIINLLSARTLFSDKLS